MRRLQVQVLLLAFFVRSHIKLNVASRVPSVGSKLKGFANFKYGWLTSELQNSSLHQHLDVL